MIKKRFEFSFITHRVAVMRLSPSDGPCNVKGARCAVPGGLALSEAPHIDGAKGEIYQYLWADGRVSRFDLI